MTGSGLFAIMGYQLTGICSMDITKENIEKYLLDKNGNPSRMKKKQNAEFFQAVLSANPHYDENTSLYLTYKGVECRRCNLCGSPMKIANFKIGWKETAHWCSIKCRDADPDYIEHHKEAMAKMDHAARIAKQRETVKQRYGVDHIAKTDGFKTRMKEFHATVDHVAMQEKYKQTCMEKYGVPYFFQSDAFKEWVANNEGLITKPEYAIHELIASLGLVAQANNRTILPDGKEIDIWVEEKQVGFEVNGVYWHSSWDRESDQFTKKRHLEKSIWAKDAGIRLVHFTDIEVVSKWPIVSSMIKSILGKTDRRIYARKCEVKMIDYQTGHAFLNKTHIQGGAPCALWVGLYHGEELVSVMGFNKARFDKNYEWELVRFASALNTTVVGGFSKCLKAFREMYKGSVVSYADFSRSNGDVYRINGFVEKGISQPSYRWVKGRTLYNRHSFMHRNLVKMLGEENYNPEESESENCWRNGYRRIWDCGQIKFVLE